MKDSEVIKWKIISTIEAWNKGMKEKLLHNDDWEFVQQ